MTTYIICTPFSADHEHHSTLDSLVRQVKDLLARRFHLFSIEYNINEDAFTFGFIEDVGYNVWSETNDCAFSYAQWCRENRYDVEDGYQYYKNCAVTKYPWCTGL